MGVPVATVAGWENIHKFAALAVSAASGIVTYIDIGTTPPETPLNQIESS